MVMINWEGQDKIECNPDIHANQHLESQTHSGEDVVLLCNCDIHERISTQQVSVLLCGGGEQTVQAGRATELFEHMISQDFIS